MVTNAQAHGFTVAPIMAVEYAGSIAIPGARFTTSSSNVLSVQNTRQKPNEPLGRPLLVTEAKSAGIVCDLGPIGDRLETIPLLQLTERIASTRPEVHDVDRRVLNRTTHLRQAHTRPRASPSEPRGRTYTCTCTCCGV
eukprot:2888018-Prymnesium_polylepis.1